MVTVMVGPLVMKVTVMVVVKVTVMDFKKMIHRIPRTKARKKAKG